MTDHSLGDGPIEPEYELKMVELAHVLDAFFNGDLRGPARHTGFVLLTFNFNDHEGRANYLSNRKDIITLFTEQIARFKGAPEQKGRA